MKQKQEIRVYKIMNTVLLVLLLVFFVFQNWQFNELNSIIDDYIEIVDKQRQSHDEIVSLWEESYDELQTKYGKLLVEHDQLLQKEVPYGLTEEEIVLLSKVVQTEAGTVRTHHEQSQRYIVQVILNRMKSEDFPDNLTDVIYQKTAGGVAQFSVAYNGMLEDCDLEAETLLNVWHTLNEGTDLPEYVLYFYSASVEENWVNTLNVYDTVQGTVFAYE